MVYKLVPRKFRRPLSRSKYEIWMEFSSIKSVQVTFMIKRVLMIGVWFLGLGEGGNNE